MAMLQTSCTRWHQIICSLLWAWVWIGPSDLKLMFLGTQYSINIQMQAQTKLTWSPQATSTSRSKGQATIWVELKSKMSQHPTLCKKQNAFYCLPDASILKQKGAVQFVQRGVCYPQNSQYIHNTVTKQRNEKQGSTSSIPFFQLWCKYTTASASINYTRSKPKFSTTTNLQVFSTCHIFQEMILFPYRTNVLQEPSANKQRQESNGKSHSHVYLRMYTCIDVNFNVLLQAHGVWSSTLWIESLRKMIISNLIILFRRIEN